MEDIIIQSIVIGIVVGIVAGVAYARKKKNKPPE